MLLTAVPRDVLLSHPELAAASAAARIFHGSQPRDRGSWPPRPQWAWTASPGPRAERLRVVLDLVETAYARGRGDLGTAAATARRIPEDPRPLAASGSPVGT